MQLLGLVKSPDHVCCRYRLEAFRPLLARSGHDLELKSWPRSWLGRLWLQRQLKQVDVVIVQRLRLTPWDLMLLRRFARWLVYDLDDAIFLRDSYAASGQASATRLHRFSRMVRAADVVVAGNDYLADRAAAAVEGARVRVVPTCVDPERYPLARHDQAGVCLTWIGSSSTLKGLERSAPLWNEIGRRCPGVRLKLICDRSLALDHLPVQLCPWSEATEAQDLADADIGISWLPDDAWSRGKCGLKVLQYMAAGLPVIANPVGVQADLVRPGRTGYLAETPEQWCEAVARLAADPALRRQLGLAGRRLVETQFSLAAGAASWTAILDQLTETPRSLEVAA